MLLRTLFPVLLATAALGCGSPPSPDTAVAQPSTETTSAGGAPAAATAEPGAARADEHDEPTRSDRPQRAPVLAVDSHPSGVEPLTEAEQVEAKRKCQPISDAVDRLARKDRLRKPATAYVEQVLSGPPVLPEAEFRRCAQLIRRDLVAYEARSREAEAINHLKRIVVGLSMAMSGAKPRLCPSAPAVPTDHRSLAKAPYRSKPQDWKATGWQCVRFDLHGAPQRFQYELSTDDSSQSFEIIARGYSVDGQPPVELYLPGKVDQGAIQPTSNVYRRR